MNAQGKRELAQAIKDTYAIRDSSWNGKYFRYDMGFSEAGRRAGLDPSTNLIVSAMLISGYANFDEWADAVLESEDA